MTATPSITPDMTIAEIIRVRPEAGRILREHGMHCIGCAVSTAESLSEAAEVHGIDLKRLLDALNQSAS